MAHAETIEKRHLRSRFIRCPLLASLFILAVISAWNVERNKRKSLAVVDRNEGGRCESTLRRFQRDRGMFPNLSSASTVKHL
jgi:hypothetical protein